ncbi:hypothetical protein MSAN_02092900 [Mycena sanguinolenta]|uniref:Uncharacterized protein n=1 Tax=Mycena sanguinolenta TaxID=230812 RepID=A0A8H7CMU0_9AGAR|nr:hypothetical protein MSAN_02092900 [Mycena sanguinolenta]
MPTISVPDINLAVAVLESHLYGAYVVLASYTLYLMITRHRGRRGFSNCNDNIRSRSPFLSPVALGTFIVFIAVTAHWLLNVIRLYIGFHDCRREQCLGPQGFYSDHSQVTEILKYGCMVVSMSVGEALIIHRLWLIWAFRTNIIIVPSTTLVGMTAFGVGLTYQLSTYDSDNSTFKIAIRRWCTGLCFCSIGTATYNTIFIWYKLWHTSRALTKLASDSSLSKVIRIFLDSAALFRVWGLFHVVAFERGSNLQFLAIDCLPVIAGISNLLIQIRLHWDLTNYSQQRMEPKFRVTTSIRFAPSDLQVGSNQFEDFGAHSKEDLSTEIRVA